MTTPKDVCEFQSSGTGAKSHEPLRAIFRIRPALLWCSPRNVPLLIPTQPMIGFDQSNRALFARQSVFPRLDGSAQEAFLLISSLTAVPESPRFATNGEFFPFGRLRARRLLKVRGNGGGGGADHFPELCLSVGQDNQGRSGTLRP